MGKRWGSVSSPGNARGLLAQTTNRASFYLKAPEASARGNFEML